MKYTLITIGSEGDVRPYVLLAKELIRRGHQVKIAAFNSFEGLIRENNIDFYPLTGDAKNFIGKIMEPNVNGLTYLMHLRSALSSSIAKLLEDMYLSCEDAQAIVGTFFGTTMYSIAEKKDIPCIQTHFFPIDYNSTMPISSAPIWPLGPLWHKATYRIGHFLISIVEKIYLSSWRKSKNMRPHKISTTLDNSLKGEYIPTLYAISPSLISKPKEWGEHIHLTGFWVDKKSDAIKYTPEAELISFLDKHQKVIYIGFGSMVSGDMDKTLNIVLKAIEEAGVPAIISKGWGGDSLNLQTKDKIYAIGHVPHAWLFDRVTAVVHHGGAGTTAAGLMAGKPTLIVPFGGDQFFWGDRIFKGGLGPKPIPRKKLTVKKLAKGLTKLVDSKDFEIKARELQKDLLKEDGIKSAVDIIEMKTLGMV